MGQLDIRIIPKIKGLFAFVLWFCLCFVGGVVMDVHCGGIPRAKFGTVSCSGDLGTTLSSDKSGVEGSSKYSSFLKVFVDGELFHKQYCRKPVIVMCWCLPKNIFCSVIHKHELTSG